MLAMILGGCVGKSHWVWQNPEKTTDREFLEDKKECRDLASEESSRIDYYYDYSPFGRPFGIPFYSPYHRHNYHGNRHTFFNDDRYFQEQDAYDRFFRVCMKAKGWKWVKVEKEKDE